MKDKIMPNYLQNKKNCSSIQTNKNICHINVEDAIELVKKI